MYILSLAAALFWLCLSGAPTALADIAPPKGWRPIQRCVSIDNLAQFPQVALVARAHLGSKARLQYRVKSGKCLDKGYKFNLLDIYALPAGLAGSGPVKDLDLPKDPRALPTETRIETYGGYAAPNNPLRTERVVYAIAGFKDGKLILYKKAESKTFRDGRPPQSQTWPAPRLEGLRPTP